MLKKKHLAAIPPMDMPSASTVPKEQCPNLTHLLTARVLRQEDGDILDIHVWALNVYIPIGLVARTFIKKSSRRHFSVLYGQRESGPRSNQKGWEYTYRPFDKPRFSEASLSSIAERNLFHTKLSRYITVASDDSAAIIRRCLRGDQNPVEAIDNFQSSIRDKKTAERKAAKERAVKEAMRHIFPLPKDWDSFVDDYPLLHSRYIIYNRDKGKKVKGFCTHCGADVVLPKAKHNARGICPACGSPATLKSSGITHWLTDWGYASYIQPAGAGAFYVRSFSFVRGYCDGLRNFHQKAYEDRRYYVLPDGEVAMYDKYDGKWRKRESFDERATIIYPHNIRQTLSETRYQYCGLEVMADSKMPVFAIGYLREYDRFPGLEYLPKMGLYRLAADCSSGHYGHGILNYEGATPKEMFPFGKEAIKTFARLNMSADEIHLYKSYEKAGYRLTEEWIEHFRAVDINYWELLNMGNGIVPFRAYRYLVKQKTSNHTFPTLQRLWRDYLRMAEAEGYDLQDDYYLYPPKLVEMHDELDTLGRMKKIDKKYIEKMKRRAGECAALNFQGDQYIIRVPASLDDLVYNGMKQKICVANPTNGYIQAYCSKKKYLLFLRRVENPDAPYVTFEMSAEGRIGQISAYDNHTPPSSVRTAINRWHKNIAMPFIEQKTEKIRVAVAV